MNKMAEYTRGRMDGLDLALRIVREGGVEALEEEIVFRGKTGIHMNAVRKEREKMVETIKQRVLDLFIVLTIASLHDVYGFGKVRCKRVLDKIEEGAMLVSNDMATWEDYINAIKETTGMNIEIEWR